MQADAIFAISQHRPALPLLSFKLPEALVLCRERFADSALALLLRFKLTEPALESAFAKVDIFAELTNIQALDIGHLRHLELKVCGNRSSKFCLFTCNAVEGGKLIVVSF